MSTRSEVPDSQSANVIRTFVCIEIPDSIKSRVTNLQETLRNIGDRVSWTKPSNINITLKFLGDVEASRIEGAANAIERAAHKISPFEIEIGGVGCFPSTRSPKVFWIGVSNMPQPLQTLHSNIEDELERLGFKRENRKFSPHLTMGRVRGPHNSARLAEALIATGFESETFTATELILMRSDLDSAGSIYTPQAVIRL
jgi:2'-5' RNA ligase